MFIFRFWFRLLRAYMIWDRYQQEEGKVYRHHGSLLLGAEATPSGLLKMTSCCLRQLWLLLYTLLSTVASPVVHMHREHIYTVSVYASSLQLWHFREKKNKKKKHHTPPKAHATATARIGTKGSWFVLPATCNLALWYPTVSMFFFRVLRIYFYVSKRKYKCC